MTNTKQPTPEAEAAVDAATNEFFHALGAVMNASVSWTLDLDKRHGREAGTEFELRKRAMLLVIGLVTYQCTPDVAVGRVFRLMEEIYRKNVVIRSESDTEPLIDMLKKGAWS